MKDKKTFQMSKRFYSRLLFTSLLVIAGMVFAAAQTIHSLSVEDAIILVKKNNIQVKKALTDLALQEQTNKEITADALPHISGTAGSTDYFNIPVTLVPGEFFQQPPGTYYPVAFQQKFIASGGFTLSQTLFDGSVFVGLTGQIQRTRLL